MGLNFHEQPENSRHCESLYPHNFLPIKYFILCRAIVNNLLAEVGNAIFTTHEKMTSSSRDNQLYQNRVLQMMFDVKFVASLFAGDTDVKVEVSLRDLSILLSCLLFAW